MKEAEKMARIAARSLLPLVVVVALLAVATAGAAPTLDDEPGTESIDVAQDGSFGNVVDTTNSSGYLFPTDAEPESEGYARNGVNVAGAVEMSEIRLRGRLQENSLLKAFENAEDAPERADLLREDVGRLERTAGALETNYRDVLGAYSEGDVSDRAFLRTMARLDARASQIERQTTRIRTLWIQTNVPGAAAEQTRTRNVAAELVPLTDRVSEQIQLGLRGEDSPEQFYIFTTPGGGVVASVDEEEFHRKVTALDQRDRAASNRFENGTGQADIVALQRAAELYPWAFDNSISTVSLDNPGNTSVYRIGIPHPHGDLVTHIDGGTTNAYTEEQTKMPRLVPATGSASATSDGLELTVNTTAPTGPMVVTLTEASTGQPVDGEIAVGDESVGSTGSDGQLRVVQPRDAFQVTATAGEDTVTVTAP